MTAVHGTAHNGHVMYLSARHRSCKDPACAFPPMLPHQYLPVCAAACHCHRYLCLALPATTVYYAHHLCLLLRREGVYDAVPLYDKAAKRYIVAATCGGKGAVLLAATATSDPTGPWFLFMLLADAAETGMACSNPKETALADAVRVTHDGNGVYLSL